MTNHIHLLATPDRADSLARTLQSLGRRYVRYVNFTQGRTGTLWEGRYRAAPIDSDAYLMACCRYIELNPVRARMVRHPREYRWSSYRANAQGVVDPIVTPHALYRSLGRSARERQESYRELFRERLPDAFIDDLRTATNGGWALGDDAFRRRIAKGARRRAQPLPKGRPAAKASNKQAAAKSTLTPYLRADRLLLHAIPGRHARDGEAAQALALVARDAAAPEPERDGAEDVGEA